MPVTEQRRDLGTKQVVLDLQQQLEGARQAEKRAEAAIAVYKAAGATMDRLCQVQQQALALAEKDMQQRDVDSLETPVGRARRDEETGALIVE